MRAKLKRLPPGALRSYEVLTLRMRAGSRIRVPGRMFVGVRSKRKQPRHWSTQHAADTLQPIHRGGWS